MRPIPLAEAFERGRALRSQLRRREHGTFNALERDSVSILERQNETRIPELVPVRMGRMLQSPFAHYRGGAALLASDLPRDRHTGVSIVVCGDAHLANFGLYASPERRMLFDLNDFDEAFVAPWEWDVKRFATSIIVAGRENTFSEAECRDTAQLAVGNYREHLGRLFRMSALERFFFQVETDWVEKQASSEAQKVIRKSIEKARGRTSDRIIEKLVVRSEEGTSRIIDEPPLVQHTFHIPQEELEQFVLQYRTTLRTDASLLLSQFQLVDGVLRVVGVGSVGTRCYVALFEGPAREPLFLQVKEAPPSVLETYGGARFTVPEGFAKFEKGREGHRVVACQRVLQAQSDPFLGWIAAYAGDRAGRPKTDFYFRQFRDMKGSIELRALGPSQFRQYAMLCATLLARAHSQSPGGALIAGYLGNSENFDEAIAKWAVAYADQNERDFAALGRAANSGRVPVERGM